jgi:MFS family permease
MALFNGMVNVAAPYLAIYMLDELHYSYMTYTVVILAGTLIGNLIIPAWGRLSDAHGNEIVLRWSMLPVALLPFLWIVSPHPVWLLLTYLVSGVMWGGLNLSMVNFIYDAAPPDTRAHSIAYFNVINGVCISLGTLAGGWILEIIPAFHGSFFLSLFILSGVLRTISVLIFHRFVKEVRAVRQIGLREVVFDLMRQRVIQILGYSSDPSDKGKSS